MSKDALARARADIVAGRLWRARDRLTGLLVHRQDDQVLDLLATVHHRMCDLPAAGAIWYITGRDDPEARAAIEAWRRRYGSDEERWRSLPGPIRRTHTADRVLALRTASGTHTQDSAGHCQAGSLSRGGRMRVLGRARRGPHMRCRHLSDRRMDDHSLDLDLTQSLHGSGGPVPALAPESAFGAIPSGPAVTWKSRRS